MSRQQDCCGKYKVATRINGTRINKLVDNKLVDLAKGDALGFQIAELEIELSSGSHEIVFPGDAFDTQHERRIRNSRNLLN